MLARARRARYPPSSLRELPRDWVCQAFEARDGEQRLRPELASDVVFLRHDVRTDPPDGPFDLVLCRNLAFTYFDRDGQARVAELLTSALRPGGALVVGAHETPPNRDDLVPWRGAPCVWRRV